jgi:hypothetical protein
VVVEPAQEKSRTFRVTFCTNSIARKPLYLRNIAGPETPVWGDRGREILALSSGPTNSDEEEDMKKFLSYFSVMAGTALVTLALSSAIMQPKASAAPAPVPVAAAVAAPAPVATPERHPHIDEALEHMRAAKHALETAEHDFDGHRMKSIEHLNASIREAEICLNMR